MVEPCDVEAKTVIEGVVDLLAGMVGAIDEFVLLCHEPVALMLPCVPKYPVAYLFSSGGCLSSSGRHARGLILHRSKFRCPSTQIPGRASRPSCFSVVTSFESRKAKRANDHKEYIMSTTEGLTQKREYSEIVNNVDEVINMIDMLTEWRSWDLPPHY